MNKNFEDIFEAISVMHKKYSSKEYLENLDKFSNDSKELEHILEKYNVTRLKSKGYSKRKRGQKI